MHIDYILYIGGLKTIGEGVIFQYLQLQQLWASMKPRPHLPFRDADDDSECQAAGVGFRAHPAPYGNTRSIELEA